MKYPDITVKLTETDGDALAIISKVSRSLSSNGVKKEECREFEREAMSGDYNNVLQTAMAWVNTE